MTTIAFTVPGHPKGKGRPRAFKLPNGQIRTYTPDATAKAEESFIALAAPYAPAHPLTGPLALSLTAVFAIPKSYTRKKREEIAAGTRRPTGKPDLDNLTKLVLDAMNGVFYIDDQQVVDMTVSKVYGEAPCYRVQLSPATCPKGGVAPTQNAAPFAPGGALSLFSPAE